MSALGKVGTFAASIVNVRKFNMYCTVVFLNISKDVF